MSAIAVPIPGELEPATDRRQSGERFVTIFRAGKLSRERGEELCVLRNVSSGGAMLHHNGQFSVGERVTLDLRLDENLDGRIAWVGDGRCGMAFGRKIDLERLLAGHAEDGLKPRQPRLRLVRPAKLKVDAHELEVVLRDVSQNGACIAYGSNIVPSRPEMRLGLDGLGDYRAIVRWRRGGFIGFNFASTLPMWALNEWVRGT